MKKRHTTPDIELGDPHAPRKTCGELLESGIAHKGGLAMLAHAERLGPDAHIEPGELQPGAVRRILDS